MGAKAWVPVPGARAKGTIISKGVPYGTYGTHGTHGT